MKSGGRAWLYAVAVGLASVLAGIPADAANTARPLITRAVDNNALVVLRGNTRPEAKPENDRGPVAEALPLDHMTLLLRRSPEREAAFDRLIDALHDPASPHYHHWLDAAEIGDQFGPANADLATLKNWLAGRGFRVNFVHADRMTIDFSGTAGQLRTAFHTELHRLDVAGEKHVAAMQDPSIPSALAPAVVGIVALNDFRPRPQSGKPSVAPCVPGSCEPVTPRDLATIYDFRPLYLRDFIGRGQRIAVVNNADAANLADWKTFRSTYGLAAYVSGSLTQIHPQPVGGFNCGDPGASANAMEAIADAEWSSAAAPGAQILLAVCQDTFSQDGLLTAVTNLEEQSRTTRPQVISLSYGECEADLGVTVNAAYNAAFKNAVAEGISVFSASGDQLMAGCDKQNGGGSDHGPAVSGLASTPYDVAVGATDFGDTYHNTVRTYWTGATLISFPSAKSYIPEIPWNSSCGSSLISRALGFPADDSFCNNPSVVSLDFNRLTGTGGGNSGCATGFPTSEGIVSGTCAGYKAPSWQRAVLGLPANGIRRYPDVSIFGASYSWNHTYVLCATSAGGCKPGYGGTSFSTPIMAGIQALVNQKMKATTGEGNPNVVYYKLAGAEYKSPATRAACNSTKGIGISKSCVFHDVTEGNIGTFCFTTGPDCLTSVILYGLLQPVYSATEGWDYATGLGSVDVANLADAWPTVAP